jgi:diadenosine tetraphosphate (Ap4A) HIT family hydrolase
MKEIFGQLGSYDEAPWAKAPKAYQNIVHEDENVIVYKDGFPVTEGHLLFVPKKRERQSDITKCFELAYKWGVRGICDYKWEAFNIGINNGVAAGQTVMWPHVHLIPRREGDLGCFENGTPYDPKGGVRNIIPHKGHYDDAIFSCPTVDDNTPREELDSWVDDNHWSKRI